MGKRLAIPLCTISATSVILLAGSQCLPAPLQPAGILEMEWWRAGWGFVGICAGLLLILPFMDKERNASTYWQNAITGVLLLWGAKEACMGLLQLFDFLPSNHSLYAFTGSFYNPGPYCGFLAVIFPIAFHEFLNSSKRVNPSFPYKVYSSVTGLVCLLLLAMIAAGASRAAWCATALSACWIYGHMYNFHLHSWLCRHKKLASILIVGILAAGIAIFFLKKDSALGRLFIWKISSSCILDKPLAGNGNFEYAYGLSQENYFAQSGYAEWEERVAGCPQYAFNEYIQTAVEYGLPMLAILLLVLFLCFRKGVRKKRIAACGGLLSLAVFAFFSYPMEFPAFAIALFLLLSSCCIDGKIKNYLLLAIVSGIIGFSTLTHNTHEEAASWNECHILYQQGAYESAREGYEQLCPRLKVHYSFLFEYGHCLHKLQRFEESNRILAEAEKLSCDPMILNVIGKNHQALQHFAEAEKYFIRSSHRLPNRIYPYYLLAKLYAEPSYYHPDKFKEMADMVLHKKPKVHSKAIDDMRKEIEDIAQKCLNRPNC